MHIADAHCHLQDDRLAADRAGVLDRAAAAGVSMLVCCGSSESDWAEVSALSAKPGVIPAYGLHPWYVRQRSGGWRNSLASLLRGDPRAAVGEIGLDHAIADRSDGEQAALFSEQLRMAAEFGRPACIHCRKAWGALLPALTATRLPSGFVIHSYSGSTELIAPLSELGAHFSFSGTVTWSRNRRAHEAAVAVPADRLLIETDAPDLPPAPGNGSGPLSANEPANLVRVLRSVAALRGITEEDLAEITWANTVRLFGAPRQ
jgi:TatD DNase family protein